MRPLVPVLAVVVALSLSASPSGAQGVASRIDALFDAPPFDGMHVGALVVDVETGETLYSRNAGKRFVPASNQKVLTTVAALERLGPDHRYHTDVVAEGAIGPDGILVGDLVIRGNGDPSLSERYHASAEAPLLELADQLRLGGLRRVRGDLVIEAVRWDSTRVEETWMWGDLPYGYAAVSGPFVLSEGLARVEARAGAPGEPVVLRWWPVGDPGRFTSSARSVPPSPDTDLDARIRLEGPLGVEVTGTLAAFTADTLELSVQDPSAEAGAVLRRVLADRGIDVDGVVRVRRTAPPCPGVPACGGGTTLATLRSPALIEIVQGVLEPSQNWMAEQLLHHLGTTLDDGRAGWPDGTRAVRDILRVGFGVDSLDLTVRDGSGLSAYNLVTPRALVGILAGVHRRPWAAAYARALAEPGERESTLERRLDGLEGRLYAKTGTITHVNSLSGYLDTTDGRRLAFAFLTNASGVRSAQVRAVIDRAVRTLADPASRP